MVSAILGLFSTLVGWLITHLPVSPFANMTISDLSGTNTYTLQQILAWVNWFIPFQDMAALMTAWLLVVVSAAATMYVWKTSVKVGTNGVLGGEEA